jgi:hypothetical protein
MGTGGLLAYRRALHRAGEASIAAPLSLRLQAPCDAQGHGERHRACDGVRDGDHAMAADRLNASTSRPSAYTRTEGDAVTTIDEIRARGFLEEATAACEVRAIVDKHGAAFVIDTAVNHERRKERAAHDAYQRERDALHKAFAAQAAPKGTE